MADDRLVLLGTKGGPAIRKGGPNPTASLLVMEGQPIVVDAALGVTRALVEAGMPLRELATIFLTHLHSDHVLELGGLIHTAWTSGLARQVAIYGPVGTRALWDGFRASLAFDIGIRVEDEGRPDLAQLVTVTEFGEGPVATLGGITVSALRVHHPPVTECYALRFDCDGWSVTFSSDTAYFEPLGPFAAGTDILVHEAMLLDGVDRIAKLVPNGARVKAHILASHTEAYDAARIAAAAQAGHLVLHHLLPADDPTLGEADFLREVRRAYDGPVTIPQDGHEIKRKDAP
ncbi:ribonuclease BN (tRNA processing enzyme) [Rubricella aquisinus]|uniref:Ribonuclease BN (tRNA processing enzyme) n=1 Tax=Rubricella aquisinus TaxID=2028108 RepID=A0A840WU43_9RHOB|nr:MBL fold metallo-hydrolase [Rubricella aquisinus]MBB5517202.1 ribonuclease BN (tRNA processing enzyme) [Rubricella aquisinus]